MPITVQYDREADALYIRLTDADRARTVEIDDTTYVDVDAADRAVGIELLYPSLGVNLENVAARFHLQEHVHDIAAGIAESGAPVPATFTASSTHLASSWVTTFLVEGTVPAARDFASTGAARADQVISAR
jgi:uncharacterized protein YuzE